jgi:hypothetical protein
MRSMTAKAWLPNRAHLLHNAAISPMYLKPRYLYDTLDIKVLELKDT